MTNAELIDALFSLEQDMIKIAQAMAVKPYPLSYHSKKLYGAAGIVKNWYENIDVEEEK